MGQIIAGTPTPKNVELCLGCQSSLLWYREDADLPRYSRAGPDDTRKQWCFRCGDHDQTPGERYVKLADVMRAVDLIFSGVLTKDGVLRYLSTEPKPLRLFESPSTLSE